MTIPNLLEETSKGIQPIHLEDDLLSRREVFLITDVNPETATNLLMQLKCLENRDDSSEITLYINSPGGDVRSGLVLYDYSKAWMGKRSKRSIKWRLWTLV